MKILLVEDDKTSIEAFQDSVKIFKIKNKVDVEYVIVENTEEAFGILSGDFDGAIVDLKLGADAEGGSKVIDRIYQNFRIPVSVHTGTPKELAVEIPEYVVTYVRGECTYEEMLNRHLEIYKTGLTRIFGSNGCMENALNSVFWKHLPKAFSHWIDNDSSDELKEKQLLRYTLSHIQEILAIDEKGIDENRNSAEFYIYPPIKDSISEGVLIREKATGNQYIVLTPACDISQKKADFIQLAKIESLLNYDPVKRKGNADSRQAALTNLIMNKSGRYHFLPHYMEFGPSLIDFQNLSSISLDEQESRFVKMCTVAAPFYKDIVARFSSNYSRQGSPDFNVASLAKEISEMY